MWREGLRAARDGLLSGAFDSGDVLLANATGELETSRVRRVPTWRHARVLRIPRRRQGWPADGAAASVERRMRDYVVVMRWRAGGCRYYAVSLASWLLTA